MTQSWHQKAAAGVGAEMEVDTLTPPWCMQNILSNLMVSKLFFMRSKILALASRSMKKNSFLLYLMPVMLEVLIQSLRTCMARTATEIAIKQRKFPGRLLLLVLVCTRFLTDRCSILVDGCPSCGTRGSCQAPLPLRIQTQLPRRSVGIAYHQHTTAVIS